MEDPEHINVYAGMDLTIRKLDENVREIVYPEVKIVFENSKPDGTPHKLLDTGKLRDLGWTTKIDFTKGVKDTYAWYLSRAL